MIIYIVRILFIKQISYNIFLSESLEYLFMNNYIQSNNELLSELYKQNIYLYDMDGCTEMICN